MQWTAEERTQFSVNVILLLAKKMRCNFKLTRDSGKPSIPTVLLLTLMYSALLVNTKWRPPHSRIALHLAHIFQEPHVQTLLSLHMCVVEALVEGVVLLLPL